MTETVLSPDDGLSRPPGIFHSHLQSSLKTQSAFVQGGPTVRLRVDPCTPTQRATGNLAGRLLATPPTPVPPRTSRPCQLHLGSSVSPHDPAGGLFTRPPTASPKPPNAHSWLFLYTTKPQKADEGVNDQLHRTFSSEELKRGKRRVEGTIPPQVLLENLGLPQSRGCRDHRTALSTAPAPRGVDLHKPPAPARSQSLPAWLEAPASERGGPKRGGARTRARETIDREPQT